MPYESVKFTQGINQKSGAPLQSPYNMIDCYIDPFDEVKTWVNGGYARTLSDKWLPRNKPFEYFNGRWFDKDTHDAAFRFRNRLYLSKTEGSGNSAEIYTAQLIDGVSDVDEFFQWRYNNRPQYAWVLPTSSSLHSNNSSQVSIGTISSGLFGFATGDDGIVGITNQRAVDFAFVPYDRYGQAGPWFFTTVYIDKDPAVFKNVSGTDIKTATVEFNFGLLLTDFFADTDQESELGYKSVHVYRTVEYDLMGVTTDTGSSGAEFSPGGFFLEGIASEPTYLVKSYWPYDIQKEASTLTDQLGPAITISRNHWINTINKRSTNLAGKTVHMDRGVAIYGNTSKPTKLATESYYQTGSQEDLTITFATSPDTITRSAGSWITAGYSVGDNVWIEGATNAGNNIKCTISAVTATVLTVDETLTAEGPTAGVTVWNAPEVAFVYKYIQEDNTVVTNSAGIDVPGIDHRAFRHKKSIVPYNGSEDGVRVYTKFNPDIVSIDSASDTITVRGDWSGLMARPFVNTPGQFVVSGSASNDGTFDIAASSGATDVDADTGGELTIDADAGTFTRSSGSFVTDGYTIGDIIVFVAFSPNIGYYTITNVTATTLTVSEPIPRSEEYTEGIPYTIGGRSISVSGGNTQIPVSQNITVSEGAVGNIEFYVLWEDIEVDVDGRYKSKKQQPGQFFTFNAQLEEDFDFYDANSYENPQILADIPTGVNVIEEKSRFYLSAVNAPWEITLDGGITPDSGEIIAITPARIEESEQLTSYEFYIFTDSQVYAAQRTGTSVSLNTVESTTGCQRGEANQPLAIPVKGGVCFWGTDDQLYYLSGRQLTKLSYPIDTLLTDVQDLAYDPKDDFMYVKAQSTDGVYVYDFNRNLWMGHMRNASSFESGEIEITFEAETDGTTLMAGDQLDTDLFLGDTYIIDQNDFRFFAESVGGVGGVRLELIKTVVSPPSTTSVAVVEQPATGSTSSDWTVISGAILSGDVQVDPSDTLHLEVNTLGAFQLDEGFYRVKIKGIHEDPATVAGNMRLNSMEYDPVQKNMVFTYKNSTEDRVLLFEERDESGAVRNFPEIQTQEFDTVFTRNAKEVRVNVDGPLYSQTGASTTAGSTTMVEGTGDDINSGLDIPGVIKIPGAGLDIDGNAADLITFIAAESGGNVTLASAAAATLGSVAIQWRRPPGLKLYMNDDAGLRSREIGVINIIPNKPYYPKTHDGHRLRIEVQDFETLREILIFIEDKLDSD